MFKNVYKVKVQSKEKYYTLFVHAFSNSGAIQEARELLDNHNRKEDIILLSTFFY
jgi:hypothetical protein